MKRAHIQCFHLLEIFLPKRKTNHPMKILLKRKKQDYEDHPCFPTLITRKQLEKPCPPNSKEMRKYFQENGKKTREWRCRTSMAHLHYYHTSKFALLLLCLLHVLLSFPDDIVKAGWKAFIELQKKKNQERWKYIHM